MPIWIQRAFIIDVHTTFSGRTWFLISCGGARAMEDWYQPVRRLHHLRRGKFVVVLGRHFSSLGVDALLQVEVGVSLEPGPTFSTVPARRWPSGVRGPFPCAVGVETYLYSSHVPGSAHRGLSQSRRQGPA